MKSTGKRFEDNFRESVPKNVFYYRFRDSSNVWSNGTKTRFTPSNIADCELFDGKYLYLLELKSCKGASLPLNNIIPNKTKQKQIEDLLFASKFLNIIAGVVIEFSNKNECYFLEINTLNAFLKTASRKSIPIDYCKNKGIEIEMRRMKVNSRFNIEKFLKDIIERVV